jgi:hypothetical protein
VQLFTYIEGEFNVKKRFKPTLIAFVVLVILMVYANYFETDEILLPGAEKPEQIVAIAREEVQSVSWKNINDDGLKLEYLKDGKARIVAPKEYEADMEEAEAVLRHLLDLKSEMVIAENSDGAANYGIDEKNSPTISIKTKKEEIELRLGEQMEVGSSYYLSKAGDERIYLVPSLVRGAFMKDLAALREKRAFSEGLGEVVEVKYHDGDGYVELYKSVQDAWELAKPLKGGADGAVVDGMLAKLGSLRVERFIEDEPEDLELYGIDSAGITIEVLNGEGRRFKLEVGSMGGSDTYCRVNDGAVHGFNSLEVSMLKTDLNDFRSKFIELPALSEVTEVAFRDASGSMRLERSGGHWVYESSKVENEVVKEFFTGVSRAKVRRYDTMTALKERGLENRGRARRFDVTAQGVTESWYLGAVEGVNMWVCNDNETVELERSVDTAFERVVSHLRQMIPVATVETMEK